MAKKNKKALSKDAEPKKLTLYTIELNDEQMKKLEHVCDQRVWEYYAVDYARFAFKATHEKVNIVAYESGKLVIQGKGTEDFVRDTLEAEITGEPRLGYEEFYNPDWFEPHAGLDEAGKGDLFGPLITCCVIADGDMVRDWLKKGVKDSKRMTDSSVINIEKIIRSTRGVVVQTAYCGMNKYNQLMSKPRANLNRLMAWLHARALEDALKKKPVSWGLLDQFSKEPLVQKLIKDEDFELRMRTKAESDPVVAAASICARAEFVRQMDTLSKKAGETLKKGASAEVKKQAQKIVANKGPDVLGEFAKLHFKTAREVLGLPVASK